MAEWDELEGKQRVLRWISFIGGVLAVWMLWQGILSIAAGRYVHAACYVPTGLLVAVSVCAMLQILSLRRRQTPAIGKQGSSSFRVTVTRVLFLTYLVAFPLALVASSVFAFGLWTHRLQFEVSAGLRALWIIGCIALAIFSAVIFVAFACGFFRLPSLEATGSELTLNGFWTRRTAEWDGIAAIEPVVRGNNAHIKVRLKDSSMTTIVDMFPTGCRPLLALLRFYLDHPKARPELDDGRAYMRLRNGEF